MDLTDARNKIDIIDKEMKELFIKRMSVSKEIAGIKAASGAKIYNPEREAEVINNLITDVDDELKPMYTAFIKKIMELSRQYQQSIINDMNI